jgi:hypothetical protein
MGSKGDLLIQFGSPKDETRHNYPEVLFMGSVVPAAHSDEAEGKGRRI